MSDIIEITPDMRVVKFTETVECGEIITTQYFKDGVEKPVRQDKEINVSLEFMMKAIQGVTS